MTIIEIKKMASNFNTEYFNDEIDLNNIQFKISKRMTRALGLFQACRDEQSIKLSYYILEDTPQLENTLIHEMVHAWQYQTGKGVSHDRGFKIKGWDIGKKSKGKYKIERIAYLPKNSIAANSINEKLRKTISTQYKITNRNGTQVNFLKKLSRYETEFLKLKGFKIEKMDIPETKISHCKNFSRMLLWKTYYPAKYFK